MKHRSKRVGAVVVAVAGLVAVAIAAYTAPDGTVITGAATCTTLKCNRWCKLCCLSFHPDNTSPAYLGCIAGCSSLPSKCGDEPNGQ